MLHRRIIRICCLLILILASLSASALEAVVNITQKRSSILIPVSTLRYMRATENKVREALNVEDNHFTFVDSVQTPFALDSAYWLKFELANKDTSAGEWILNLQFISYASVYLIDEKGTTTSKNAGRMLACSLKSNPEISKEIVRFSLRSLERKTVFIYCKTINPTVNLRNLQFIPFPQFEQQIKNEYLRYGLFLGFFGLVILSSLLLALFLRLRIYLYFALFVASFSVYLCYFLNFFALFVFPNWEKQAILFELLLFLSFVFYSLMMKFFFVTDNQNVWFSRIRSGWQIFIVASFVVLLFCFDDAELFFQIHDILVTSNLLIGTVLLFFAIKVKNKALRYFVLGSIVTAIGGLVVQFSSIFVNFEIDVLVVSLAIQALFFAIGIAVFYQELENKRKKEVSDLIEALRQQEVQLKESNTKLETKVKERTAEIEEKNASMERQFKQLEELNALKNKFLSIIGHDLKNPLGTIIGFSQMLHENVDTFSQSKIKNFANQIHQSTTHTYALLINLLDWARSQTNTIKYSPEPVNLMVLLHETLDVLRETADAKKIDMIIDIPQSQRIMVDVNMMKTILRNLISNAIKYSMLGGRIEISASVAQNASIKVRDYGVGMTEEQVQNLFRIDRNASTLGTAQEIGTGLGLIITHEFVERMKGSVAVDSKPSIGTTFTVLIPAGLPNRD